MGDVCMGSGSSRESRGWVWESYILLVSSLKKKIGNSFVKLKEIDKNS